LSVAGLAGQRYAKFSGVVLDQTNAFLPNVDVSLTSADRQTRHEVRTDRTGRFEFVGLPDGDYAIAAVEAGFAPFSEPLTIAGRDVDRTIQLHVGSLHETIVITAGGSAVKPYDPELRQKARQWAEDKSREVSQRCSGGSSAGGVGGNILQPMKIADVKPRYPERLQAAGTGGLVTLEALIGTDGTVRDVRVVTSADPDLDRAAMDAVRQWEFSSTILNCTPVEVPMGITVKFVATR
jgi:TonB family protein